MKTKDTGRVCLNECFALWLDGVAVPENTLPEISSPINFFRPPGAKPTGPSVFEARQTPMQPPGSPVRAR